MGSFQESLRSDDDDIRLRTGSSSLQETGSEHVGPFHENNYRWEGKRSNERGREKEEEREREGDRGVEEVKEEERER